MQNICERVHATKLHEGEDWHDTETIKHWTYVIGNIYISNSINMLTIYIFEPIYCWLSIFNFIFVNKIL
jgi:hypothetical protein